MLSIPCTQNCIYQQEGSCTLSRAASRGSGAKSGSCVYRIEKASAQNKTGTRPGSGQTG